MPIQYRNEQLIIFESALYRTTSTLLVGDDYLLLIDPTWLPNELKEIQEYSELEASGKKKLLLFTHSDYDHIIGCKLFDKYQKIASKNFVDNPEKDKIIAQIKTFDDQYYIERSYEISYPQIDIPIEKNEHQINFEKETYVFYQAPGHNRDGLITFNETKGILIVGDYLSNIEFPYIYHSLEAYRSTLNLLKELIDSQKVRLLISGHGDHTTDLHEMKRRVQDSKNYLDALEFAVKNNTEFDLSTLFPRYQFPEIMKQFHQANLALVKKELGYEI